MQFDRIEVPEQVLAELSAGDDTSPFEALRERGVLAHVEVDRTDLYIAIGRELDDGETPCASCENTSDTSEDMTENVYALLVTTSQPCSDAR